MHVAPARDLGTAFLCKGRRGKELPQISKVLKFFGAPNPCALNYYSFSYVLQLLVQAKGKDKNRRKRKAAEGVCQIQYGFGDGILLMLETDPADQCEWVGEMEYCRSTTEGALEYYVGSGCVACWFHAHPLLGWICMCQ